MNRDRFIVSSALLVALALIVAAHSGAIDVTSTEDGVTFTVRLPRYVRGRDTT